MGPDYLLTHSIRNKFILPQLFSVSTLILILLLLQHTTMAGDDENKIQKFNGRSTEDYNLWRVRAEISLKGKGYWSKLSKDDCDTDTKEKAAALLTNALGDSAFRVCSSRVDDPQ